MFVVAGCSSEKHIEKADITRSKNLSGTQVETDKGQPSKHDRPLGSVDEPSTIYFEEQGPEQGFAFQRYDDMKGQHRILEVNGGGVAIFDADLDGWPEIFLTNGCPIPVSLDRGHSPGALFRNLHGNSYANATEPSRLVQTGLKFGCATGDTDNDGFTDLYLTAYGGNQFWQNNGDGTFSEVSDENGTRCGEWGSSAAFADLNEDGCLDLYVANYLQESDTNPVLCPEPKSPDGYAGCSPAIFDGVPDRLFLSDGRGGFVDVSDAAGLSAFPGKALGVAICNLVGDSTPEIYVANDGEANYLFIVEAIETGKSDVRGVRLSEHAMTANAALNEHGYAQASMGVAVGDLDQSGTQDLFLTHFYADTNTLYLNQSQDEFALFEDATRRSQLGPPSRLMLGFGAAAADFDFDTWQDLIVANGHVDDRTWMKSPQPFHMTAQVFMNKEGIFRDVSQKAGDYFQKPRLGRGLAVGDLNRDGLQDVVISNQLENAAILINRSTTSSQSIHLQLIGSQSVRSAVGAVVEVDTFVHEVIGGGSFQSASDRMIHSAQKASSVHVKIRWPSRIEQEFDLTAGQWTLIENRYPTLGI